MKHNLFFSFLLATFIFGDVQAQALHTLDFKNPEEMYAYFTFTTDKKIIAGHRGTIENGMPENSIAAMEEVLRWTPAIFEVDPRLTKDGVAVMVHDATLERTTTGMGKVSDYTWKELQQLRLKDHAGNATSYRINTLDEMITWAKGKTILNLDKKDMPLEMTAEIIRKHNAYAWVWVTVHTVEQAKFYLDKNPKQYMSMHIRSGRCCSPSCISRGSRRCRRGAWRTGCGSRTETPWRFTSRAGFQSCSSWTSTRRRASGRGSSSTTARASSSARRRWSATRCPCCTL